MLDKIYDNGETLLGTASMLKEQLAKESLEMSIDDADSGIYEQIVDMIDELENYDADTIIELNYENSYGELFIRNSWSISSIR